MSAEKGSLAEFAHLKTSYFYAPVARKNRMSPFHFGWIDLDPTNDLIPSDGHGVLAWGRDYEDVSPIKGVNLGGGRHSMSVEVDVVPSDGPPG